MSYINQTADEVLDSLTGHDEASIAQHFGKNVGAMIGVDGVTLGRALVFVVKRREGMNDDDARNAAMDMTFKVVTGEFFAEETDEQGKDEPASEELPESSPDSAS